MCVPSAWGVCNNDGLSCAVLQKRQSAEFEKATACRVSLCAGSSPEEFKVKSPCITGGCKACLPSGAPQEWRCYEQSFYDVGFSCPEGYSWTTATEDLVWSGYCQPLIDAAPKVIMALAADSLAAIGTSGEQFTAAIAQVLVNASLFVASPNGTMTLLIDQAPPALLSLLQSALADLLNVAFPGAKVVPENVVILSIAFVPKTARKRQAVLDEYFITIQFALLKNDDPASSNDILQQAAEALAQGVVAGVDPASIAVVPATDVTFTEPRSINSTTTPKPTEVIRPRDPTSSLNGGALFGIIFGSALALVAVAAGLTFCFFKYRAAHRAPFDSARAN